MPQDLLNSQMDDDYTAVDLIHSATGGWRRAFEKDHAAIIEDPSPLFHTSCRSTSSLNPNDFTPKGPSEIDQCTFYLRQGVDEFITGVGLYDSINIGRGDDASSDQSLEGINKQDNANKNRKSLLQEIHGLFRDCAMKNWDGYDAKPVSINVYLEAVKLAGSLPKDLPVPDVMPEPNGDIAFEWYKGKRFVLILSVGGDSNITYAGLFGTGSKAYGSEYLGDSLPLSIIEKIQLLFS